jgi:hypothetical protein
MSITEGDLGPGRKLIMGLGMLVYYYATLEHWIDGAVATIFIRIEEAQKHRKVHPTNAADELEFLELSLTNIPSLAGYKEVGLNLLENIKYLSDLRHGVVHGHLDDFDAATETLKFIRVRRSARTVKRTVLSVTAPDLFQASLHIKALALEMKDLTQSLIKEFGTETDRDEVPGGRPR